MVGRNRYFFAGAEPPVPLGGGLEAWKGFYSSVRPAHNQLLVNANGQFYIFPIALVYLNILLQFAQQCFISLGI